VAGSAVALMMSSSPPRPLIDSECTSEARKRWIMPFTLTNRFSRTVSTMMWFRAVGAVHE
jgi:hypothetical protein